jgi:hypothetical protein
MQANLQGPTYRLGQVEWALWKFSTLDLPSGDEPLKSFHARVKHLLRLDRCQVLFTSAESPPPVPYALSSAPTRGTGVDAAFTAFDAFCLAMAVDLLRAGFKQSEVVLLMGYLRLGLWKPFAGILSNPPPFKSRLTRGQQPGSRTGDDKEGDDRRVFLVIQRVELSEAFPAFATSGRGRKGPIFREPLICHGIDELRDQLGKMDHVFRRAIVLEIAHMAVRIAEFLDQAPLKKRGRPSSLINEDSKRMP